jgi:very-short-patch-repair endonuclease
MTPLPPPVLALMQRQYGLISRRQLLELEITEGQAEGLFARGVLEAVHRGVYRICGSGVPLHQPAMAAVLRCGIHVARVTGAAVLRLLNVEGFAASDEIAVLVHPNRNVSNVPFTVIHDPAPLLHRARIDEVPGATPCRALIDAAPPLSDKQLRVAVDSLRFLGLATPDRLERTAAALPAQYAGAAKVLTLIAGGGCAQRSEGERSLRDVLADFEPQPVWGKRIIAGIEVDAVWEDVRLALEYDGREFHSLDTQVDADALRDLRLKLAGYEIIRVRKAMLAQPAALIAAIAAIRARLLLERVS